MISKNQQYKALIDSYFDDTMSPAERVEFIIELEVNPKLKKEFSQYKEFQNAISDPDFDKVNDIISDIIRPGEKHNPTEKNRRFSKLKYVVIAVVFIIISLLINNYFFSKDSNITIAQNYFEPYPTYNTFRGGDDSEKLKDLAFTNYDAKKYNDANVYFSQLIEKESGNIAYVFYKANALMALGDHEKAIPLFKKVVENKSTLFGDQADWYLALCYLGVNIIEEARPLLISVTQKESSQYHFRAIEILKEIQK